MTRQCNRCSKDLPESDFYGNRRVCKSCYREQRLAGGRTLQARKAGRPDERPVTVIAGGLDTPIPEPPETIRDTAIWDRLWTVGRPWLSNEAHYDLMRILAEAIEDRDGLRQAMDGEPRIKSGRVHAGLRALDAMDAKIARLLETAGFTPERQKRVVAPTKGRLDAIRDRKAGKG